MLNIKKKQEKHRCPVSALCLQETYLNNPRTYRSLKYVKVKSKVALIFDNRKLFFCCQKRVPLYFIIFKCRNTRILRSVKFTEHNFQVKKVNVLLFKVPGYLKNVTL